MEDIQAPKTRHSGIYHPLDIIRLRDVSVKRKCLTAITLDCGYRLLRAFIVDIASKKSRTHLR
ncbi:hypothetical protein XI09_06610 [Bradyrhizobium sp. CCBAU 11386]|nr:hypothetical protein [Bradyrhizobium sp. CCBAU 11386]